MIFTHSTHTEKGNNPYSTSNIHHPDENLFTSAGIPRYWHCIPRPSQPAYSTPHNRNQNMGVHISPMTQNKHMQYASAKPRRYDGTEDLDDYISQFNIISDLNKWDYTTKSLQLASQLSGQACGILGDLPETQRRDYESILQALQMRFGSIERSELFKAKLETKVKGDHETLSELAQAIKKLTRQAYPRADTNMTNTLALDHFIDAISDKEMKLRIREARPRNIEEAEMFAVRLETNWLTSHILQPLHHSMSMQLPIIQMYRNPKILIL